MSRGLIDRLTNRDIIRENKDIIKEQRFNIDYMTKELKAKNELVTVQADAIDELKEQAEKLSEEISGLWESVNSKTRMKRVEEDEPETDNSG